MEPMASVRPRQPARAINPIKQVDRGVWRGRFKNLPPLLLGLMVWQAVTAAAGDPRTPAPGAVDAAYASAEAELNQLVDQIINIYQDDDVFVGKFKTAQAAWRRFAQAHLDALYPAPDKQSAYGSAYNYCREQAMIRLVRLRIEQLRPWMEGLEEGNVCAGSIRGRP